MFIAKETEDCKKIDAGSIGKDKSQMVAGQGRVMYQQRNLKMNTRGHSGILQIFQRIRIQL